MSHFEAGVVRATFTGQEYDEENSLQYYGARYLDNEIGRFTAVDPAILKLHDEDKFKEDYNRTLIYLLEDPQNLNSYSYAVNNPVKNTDPDGEIIDIIADVGFIGYDLYSISKSYIKTGHVEKSEWAALGADTTGAFIPGVTGLGLGVRVASKADDVAKAAAHSDDLLKVVGDVPKPKVFDNILQNNHIDEIFRNTDEFIGGTATAIRKELNEKVIIGGKSHIQKGWDRIKGLENWIGKSKNAVQSDINTAMRVLNDLKDAFKLK